MTIEQIVMVVSAVVAVSGGITAWRKSSSDAASVLTGTALDMVEKLERDVERLDGQVKKLREEVERLEDENAEKTIKIRAMRSEITGLKALVEEYRVAFSAIYDQLLSNGIKPAVERPE